VFDSRPQAIFKRARLIWQKATKSSYKWQFTGGKKMDEVEARMHRKVSTSDSIQTTLEVELKRTKEKLGFGHELRVVWIPNKDSKLSGEVKDNIIYVYEPDEDTALQTLKHEIIDYAISQAIEPYKSIANKLIQLLNETAYKKKEEIVENLTKLL
jgi:hypothetical protein